MSSRIVGNVIINSTGVVFPANLQGGVVSNTTGRIKWLIYQKDGNLTLYLALMPAVTLPYSLLANVQYGCDIMAPNSQMYATVVLKYPSGLTVTMKYNGSNPSSSAFVIAVSVYAYPTLPDIKDYAYTGPVVIQLQLNETTPGIINGVGFMFGVIQVNIALTYTSIYSNSSKIPRYINITFEQLTFNYTAATFFTSGISLKLSPDNIVSISSTGIQNAYAQPTSASLPISSTGIQKAYAQPTSASLPISSTGIQKAYAQPTSASLPISSTGIQNASGHSTFIAIAVTPSNSKFIISSVMPSTPSVSTVGTPRVAYTGKLLYCIIAVNI